MCVTRPTILLQSNRNDRTPNLLRKWIMIRVRWIFFIILNFFFSYFATAQSEHATKLGVSSSIFQDLRVGQKVSLKESFGFWEVSVLNNGEIGLNTILEITPTYLVINDPMQFAKSWIPISSVHRVTILKLPVAGGQPPKP